MSKKIDLILIVLCIFFTLTLLFRLFLFPKNRENPTEEAVFLNPKYLSQLDEIIVESGSDKVIISKLGDLYLVSSGETNFFAHRDMVFQLLQCFSKKKSIFLVDETNESQYGLFGENSAKVIFRSQGRELVSFLFGNSDALLEQIYFTTPGKNGIYQTSDDFSPFFFQRLAFWADCDLIPIHRKFTFDDVMDITVEIFGEKTEIPGGKKAFTEKLLSARGGNVVSQKDIIEEIPDASVKIILKSGIDFTLDFIGRKDGYGVILREEGSEIGLTGALEISEYTFQRLLN